MATMCRGPISAEIVCVAWAAIRDAGRRERSDRQCPAGDPSITGPVAKLLAIEAGDDEEVEVEAE